jgi:hypothetical protein
MAARPSRPPAPQASRSPTLAPATRRRRRPKRAPQRDTPSQLALSRSAWQTTSDRCVLGSSPQRHDGIKHRVSARCRLRRTNTSIAPRSRLTASCARAKRGNEGRSLPGRLRTKCPADIASERPAGIIGIRTLNKKDTKREAIPVEPLASASRGASSLLSIDG